MDVPKMEKLLRNIKSTSVYLLQQLENGDVNHTPHSLKRTLEQAIELRVESDELTKQVVREYNKGWFIDDINELLMKHDLKRVELEN